MNDFLVRRRALTNFIGNAVATIVVAKWETGLDKAALDIALNSKPGTSVAPVVQADAD